MADFDVALIALGKLIGFFEGSGTEDDEVVHGHVESVKRAIAALMAEGIRAQERAR